LILSKLKCYRLVTEYGFTMRVKTFLLVAICCTVVVSVVTQQPHHLAEFSQLDTYSRPASSNSRKLLGIPSSRLIRQYFYLGEWNADVPEKVPAAMLTARPPLAYWNLKCQFFCSRNVYNIVTMAIRPFSPGIDNNGWWDIWIRIHRYFEPAQNRIRLRNRLESSLRLFFRQCHSPFTVYEALWR